eukprot:918384_1
MSVYLQMQQRRAKLKHMKHHKDNYKPSLSTGIYGTYNYHNYTSTKPQIQKPKQTIGWTCQKCTFLNNNKSNQCSMCYTPITKSNNTQPINSYTHSNYNNYYEEESYDEYSKYEYEYNYIDECEYDPLNKKIVKPTFSSNKDRKPRSGRRKNKNKNKSEIIINNNSNEENKENKIVLKP